MSLLFANPEDRFSHVKAHMVLVARGKAQFCSNKPFAATKTRILKFLYVANTQSVLTLFILDTSEQRSAVVQLVEC